MGRSFSLSRSARLSLTVGVVCVAILLASPALAVPSHKAECRRITNQVGHFVNVAEMADSRGDELWLNGTLAHIDRLKERRVRLCPEWQEPNWAAIYAKMAADMVKMAGKAFLKYMTFGAYPGL
jgi:hypothetical protein